MVLTQVSQADQANCLRKNLSVMSGSSKLFFENCLCHPVPRPLGWGGIVQLRVVYIESSCTAVSRSGAHGAWQPLMDSLTGKRPIYGLAFMIRRAPLTTRYRGQLRHGIPGYIDAIDAKTSRRQGDGLYETNSDLGGGEFGSWGSAFSKFPPVALERLVRRAAVKGT